MSETTPHLRLFCGGDAAQEDASARPESSTDLGNLGFIGSPSQQNALLSSEAPVGCDHLLVHDRLSSCDAMTAVGFTKPISVERPAIRSTGSYLASIAILMAMAGFATLMVAGCDVPLWCQPTAVGILWGGLFLAGFLLGSLGRGSLLLAVATPFFALINKWGMQVLTDLGAAECLLIAACLVVAGWFAASMDSLCRPLGKRGGSKWQLSIWDIGFLTAIAACASHALPNLSSPSMLFFAVIWAMLGGLLVCWIASRWAWHDDWSIGSLVMLAVPLLVGIVWVQSLSPEGSRMIDTAAWLFTGPLNVIASQGTAVLLVLAVLRFDFQQLPTQSRVQHAFSN